MLMNHIVIHVDTKVLGPLLVCSFGGNLAIFLCSFWFVFSFYLLDFDFSYVYLYLGNYSYFLRRFVSWEVLYKLYTSCFLLFTFDYYIKQSFFFCLVKDSIKLILQEAIPKQILNLFS